MTHRRSLIVALHSADGATGFGEAAPFEMPFYSAETMVSATACLRDVLIPRMVGATMDHPEAVRDLLGDNIRGNRMARAAVETAWWDLQSRVCGVGLSRLVDERLGSLGIDDTTRAARAMVCGAALGIPTDEDVDALLSQVTEAVKRGFQRIKIKVRPGWSVKPLLAVLDTLRGRGCDLPVSVDGNGAFHAERDDEELRALDEAGAVFVEQPFGEEDLWDSVTWNGDASTPLCLDESLVSDDVARQVIAMAGPTIWNLKVQRLGGLEETCRVYARGAAVGVQLWMGTMPETGLGAQSALAFGGLPGLSYPADVGPSSWWFESGRDLIEVEMDNLGRAKAPFQPGNLPKLDLATRIATWK